MGQMEAAVERRGPRDRYALIAAYREGLGLAAVVVTRGPAGIRVSAVRQGTGGMPDEPAAEARWWCRRAADAERVASAAIRRLRRCESRDGGAPAAPQCVSSPASGDASDALAVNKDLIGYFVVNVSDILRRLRARAEELGIDLSRQFFFPPDDPRFETILIQVKRERDARLARLRRDKKRFAAVKRRSLENVAVVRRVADAKFPSAIGLSE
jgi:hypothetical protein